MNLCKLPRSIWNEPQSAFECSETIKLGLILTYIFMGFMNLTLERRLLLMLEKIIAITKTSFTQTQMDFKCKKELISNETHGIL